MLTIINYGSLLMTKSMPNFYGVRKNDYVPCSVSF